MKPVTESPWVPLGTWKVGRLGAEGAMRERAEYQGPEETRRAHGRLPQEITDLTSIRLLSSCSPEAWWPFKDEPQPRKGEGARKEPRLREMAAASQAPTPGGSLPALRSVWTPRQPHPSGDRGTSDEEKAHTEALLTISLPGFSRILIS